MSVNVLLAVLNSAEFVPVPIFRSTISTAGDGWEGKRIGQNTARQMMNIAMTATRMIWICPRVLYNRGLTNYCNRYGTS